MNKRFFLMLIFGCAASLQAADAYEIMSHSIKLAEGNWSEAPRYSYIRTDTSSESGSATPRKTYEVLMIEGSPYLKVVAEAGHDLSPETAREEERKFQREMSKRGNESPRERRRRLQKYEEERNRDHAFLSELGAALEYSIMNEGQLDKRAVWLVEGKPKAGYIPSTREGKVLSGMRVKFWIDKATCQWLRIEAHVEQPVSLYGILAKVSPGTRFTLEQEPVSPGVWLPNRFTMEINATALGFIKKDSAQDETYTNYRLADPDATATNSSSASERAVR